MFKKSGWKHDLEDTAKLIKLKKGLKKNAQKRKIDNFLVDNNQQPMDDEMGWEVWKVFPRGSNSKDWKKTTSKTLRRG